MIVWVPRSAWGASAATELYIAKRATIPKLAKTEIHVHHTAAVDDDDATPNRWDYAEAVAYMRRLQRSRPDLGPLPYSDNLAVSEDLTTVWLFEGRGALKLGAHTGGHNRAGYGVGVLGNFDIQDVPAAEVAVRAVESRVRNLRSVGLANLGSVLNPRGWVAWGHRDTSTKTCPGHSLYPLLATIRLEDDGMITKWLNESGFRALYQLGHIEGSSEQAVVDYWIRDRAARSDAQHVAASSNILMSIGSRGGGGLPGTIVEGSFTGRIQ